MGNYPDGVWDADPRVPWNQTDPWVGETCGTCMHIREGIVFARRCHVCVDPDALAVREVESERAACEAWESYL